MPKFNLDSYPPLFRPRPTQEPDPKPIPMDGEPGPDPLPWIDMECLDEEKLDEACREYGIFRLVNHGVPMSLLSKLHEHAKRIFDFPYEAKQGLNGGVSSPIKYFWGTPALTKEGVALPRGRDSRGSNGRGAQNVDWVEGLNVPLGQLHLLSTTDHLPPLLSDFRNLLQDYRRHLTRLASTLFEAMVRNLKLDLPLPTSKALYLDESTELVRVYRYPCRNVVGDNGEHAQGMHAHTDSSILSILSQDEVGGLRFLKDEHWFDVNPIPNTLVVNLGDMMQALSDDEYKSVKHEVKLNNDKERVSICYFVFPEENSLIQSSNYKRFTYKEFRAQVQHDVKTLGSKVGLQSFKKNPQVF